MLATAAAAATCSASGSPSDGSGTFRSADVGVRRAFAWQERPVHDRAAVRAVPQAQSMAQLVQRDRFEIILRWADAAGIAPRVKVPALDDGDHAVARVAADHAVGITPRGTRRGGVESQVGLVGADTSEIDCP